MIKTYKATIHWYDTSSGQGMVKINFKGVSTLVVVYDKPDYAEFDQGQELVVNVLEDIACLDFENDHWIEYPSMCNINWNLTRMHNWNQVKLSRAS